MTVYSVEVNGLKSVLDNFPDCCNGLINMVRCKVSDSRSPGIRANILEADGSDDFFIAIL